MKSTDRVTLALIRQVTQARPLNGTEMDVRTYISRPLWGDFCEELGMPRDTEPTGWIGIKETNRVYGSETIIIEREDRISWSTAIKRP